MIPCYAFTHYLATWAPLQTVVTCRIVTSLVNSETYFHLLVSHFVSHFSQNRWHGSEKIDMKANNMKRRNPLFHLKKHRSGHRWPLPCLVRETGLEFVRSLKTQKIGSKPNVRKSSITRLLYYRTSNRTKQKTIPTVGKTVGNSGAFRASLRSYHLSPYSRQILRAWECLGKKEPRHFWRGFLSLQHRELTPA